MQIEGERILDVPRADVWRALNDPAVLQRCLAGCDTFEADGPERYRVAMQASVGPVRARFTGRLQLRDVVAPVSYALSFEGSGGVAGFGKGVAQVALDDVPEGTRLRYAAQAQVGGRLAQVGARLIDGVTRRMADDFFGRFAREVTARGREDGAGPQGAAPGAVAAAVPAARAPIPGDEAPTAAPSVGATVAVPSSDTAAAASAAAERTARPMPTHVPAPVQAPALAQAQSTQLAVIAAAVSATAAAVAVLAAVVAVLALR